MKYRRLLSIILASFLLSVSCSETPVNESESESSANTTDAATESAVETEAIDSDAADDLPDGLTFGGAEFNMLSADGHNGKSLVEGLTGEALNDARYNMEIAVEDRLDVEITETPSDFWDMPVTVNSLVMSGDTTYSCVTMMDRFALQCAQKSLFFPMEEVEYVDLTKKYWGGGLSDTLTVGGKSYFGVSSFNLQSFMKTGCIFINKKLAGDVNVEIPYDDVFGGTWTLEKLQSLEGIATNDLNGDNVMDSEDRYTFGSADRWSVPAIMWLGAGESIIKKEADDIPYIAVHNNETFLNLFEEIKTLLFTGEDQMTSGIKSDEYRSTDKIFIAGRELIHIGFFDSIVSYREMEDDFTVLPIPKYDETQDNYYSRTYDSMFTMVPTTVSDTSMAGAVLEAMSCHGYNNVIPEYIETSLQEKYTRDPQSAESIQLCFDSRTVDYAEIIMFEQFGDASIHDIITSSSMTMTTYLAKMGKIVDAKLAQFVDFIENAEE